MHALEVPEPLAGLHVERDEALGEEIGARALTAVPVVGRRGQRQVDVPELFVAAHRAPDVGVSGVRPRIVQPGLVADLAGPRDGAERPQLLAGPHVVAADVAGRRFHPRRARGVVDVADDRADDDDVADDERRRAPGVVVERAAQTLPQIDLAVDAEIRDQRLPVLALSATRYGPTSVMMRCVAAVGPVRDAAIGDRAGGGMPSASSGALSNQTTRPVAASSAATVPMPVLM